MNTKGDTMSNMMTRIDKVVYKDLKQIKLDHGFKSTSDATKYLLDVESMNNPVTKVSPSQYRINVPQPLDREESMMTLELFKRVIVGTNPGVSGFIVRFLNKGELV